VPGRSRVLVVGEALVDLVIPAEGDAVTASLGGAPFNAARVCGRLGAPVSFVGAVSDDRFGTRLVERLAIDGVDTGAIERVVVPTTLAAAELDERGTASYRFYVEGTSAPALCSMPSFEDVGVLVTGGLGLVLEPMADTVAASIASAPPNLMVVVDVNVRPLVITDRARYLERVDSVLARADVVKVSDDDLAELAPGVPSLDAAAVLVQRGPAVVLLTRGGDGVSIVTPDEVRTVPVTPVAVVDTIGAGDAFAGAFVSWWVLNGRSRDDLGSIDAVEGAVRAANAVAAVVCTRRGADPPWRVDLPVDWSS
jgi:fructokinase